MAQFEGPVQYAPLAIHLNLADGNLPFLRCLSDGDKASDFTGFFQLQFISLPV